MCFWYKMYVQCGLPCRRAVFPEGDDSILPGSNAAGTPLNRYLQGPMKGSVPPLLAGTRGALGRLCRSRPSLPRRRHRLLEGTTVHGRQSGGVAKGTAVTHRHWSLQSEAQPRLRLTRIGSSEPDASRAA